MRKISIVLLLCLILVAAASVSAQDVTEGVALTESTTTWQTLAYDLNPDGGFVPGTRDTGSIVETTFNTYILENEYLRVTLLPEYGGRILSMIYKPTGHEELYQNPLGVPYGMGEGNFYYDWLMVYGGIFPTFPEPEHGKTWFLPWDFEVITETADEVTVAMSFADNIDFARAPGKFDVGMTGLEATYMVTLKAGRAALDTQLTLHNPTDAAVEYEYWTCTTFAPGSEPGNTVTTAGAEIIAPMTQIKMPPWWPRTTAQETRTATPGVYTFENLRWFENWADMGIAYAYPDLGDTNYWGVINHDNGEGIIRVGNNDVSAYLKLWTWGFSSTEVDAFAQPTIERRPYIEMWAGVTPEFFRRTTLAADDSVVIEETYAPTVGLTGVSEANRDFIANFFVDDEGNATLQVVSLTPGQDVTGVIYAGDEAIAEMPLVMDSASASVVSALIPDGALDVRFAVLGADGTVLLEGTQALTPEPTS